MGSYRLDDLVLKSRAVLVLIDKNARIGGSQYAFDRTALDKIGSRFVDSIPLFVFRGIA